MTATEAKTAVFQELTFNSRHSDGLATVTGTAQIACSVSGKYSRMEEYRQSLAPTMAQCDKSAFLDLACQALARGFTDKWQEIPAEKASLKTQN